MALSEKPCDFNSVASDLATPCRSPVNGADGAPVDGIAADGVADVGSSDATD